MRVLVIRLIPLLRKHLEPRCEPGLLEKIHSKPTCLLFLLFPEEVVLRVGSLLHKDLKALLSRYSQRLWDCGEDLLLDVRELFLSHVDSFTYRSCSLPLSSSSGSERKSGCGHATRHWRPSLSRILTIYKHISNDFP